jgi:hypothetical protein
MPSSPPSQRTIALTASLLLALALTIPLALAQSIPGSSRGGHRGRRQQNHTAVQQPPPIKPDPQPWPRLDPGAVVCRSSADLVRYQTELGDPASTPVAAPSGCQIIQHTVGVKIIGHDGPSRTNITISDSPSITGWTNVFFPANPPPGTVVSNAQ